MALVLNEDWTAYVVGEMHKYRVSNVDLAKECGYHHTYLSTVLNGNKEFSGGEAAEKTKEHILAALERVKNRKLQEV